MLYVLLLVATVVVIIAVIRKPDDKQVSDDEEWSAVAHTDLRSTFRKRYAGFHCPKIRKT